MKLNKKIFIALLSLFIVITSNLVYASLIPTEVLMNQNLIITYNDKVQRFKNVNGEIVYPISFDGTTYLPIRSISCLFETGIVWNGNTNSIYLGKGELDTIAAEAISEFVPGINQTITANLNQDIKIYYNDEVQTFKDVNGKVVYPISYNGTTYLPVRAISNLYNANIEWVAATSTVVITKSNENMQPEESNVTWEGKYISNLDGYTEVVLTPNEKGFNFYFRGYKNGAGIAANSNAIVNGNIGVYENNDFLDEVVNKMEFKFVNSKLIVTTSDGNFKVFEGEYVLDNGTINTIVESNPNSLNGVYESEKGTLELIDTNTGKLDASFSGTTDEGSFFFVGVVLNYQNDVASVEEEWFGDINKVDMKIDGDTIVVVASSTEEDSIYENINGTYKFKEKKVWNYDECKKQAEEIYVAEDCFMF